jgi:predicted ATPase
MGASGDLVGRDVEFSDIAGRFKECVAARRAQVLLVRGAPGIGKSTVLDAFLRQADEAGGRMLNAAAFEADSIRPFAIWIDALRAYDPAAHDAIFAGADVANRDRLFGGLSERLGREAALGPVVISFDDVHWCDESSAAALHYVIRMLRDQPVFCILAARTGELRDNAAMQQSLRGLRRDGLFDEIRLGPLSAEAVTRLIALRAPDADCEKLGRESAGNPLLAIELARARDDGSVAASITDLVRERAAHMDVISAEVIGWAALLRPRIEIPTLVRLTGLDTARVGEVLEAAERYAILVPGERGLKFSHDLVARAVYTEISPLRRQVMHRRIAEMLEQDAALDLARASDLAHHATHSGDSGLAARAMASAGRLCLRFFANEEAASLARKGLQFAEDLAEAERVCAEIDLHDVLLAAEPLADGEAAAAQYAALAERALDHGQLKHARLGYQMAATVRWSQGQWAAARDQSLQAVRAIRGGEDTAHIIGMAETAKCLVLLERDLSQADAMLMEARSLAERGRVVHRSVPLALGMLRYHENRLEEAEELLHQARALCKSAGDRLNEFQVLEFLVMIDLQRGRWEQARERCEQLVELGEKLREGSELPFARALRGLCDYALDDKVADLEAAIEDLRLVDAKYRLAYTLTRAALVDCERGRKGPAEERAGEALEYARILERPTEMLIAHAILACSCRDRAEEVQATEHESEVLRLRKEAAGWTEEITARLAATR